MTDSLTDFEVAAGIEPRPETPVPGVVRCVGAAARPAAAAAAAIGIRLRHSLGSVAAAATAAVGIRLDRGFVTAGAGIRDAAIIAVIINIIIIAAAGADR